MSEFTCHFCQRTFQSDWSDEEAAAEYAEAFPDLQDVEQAVLCDDCYPKFMGWAKEKGFVS